MRPRVKKVWRVKLISNRKDGITGELFARTKLDAQTLASQLCDWGTPCADSAIVDGVPVANRTEGVEPPKEVKEQWLKRLFKRSV